MSELAAPLRNVLEATGYLSGGKPAPSVHLGASARRGPRQSSFNLDARWGSRANNLHVYFKYSDRPAGRADVASWHLEVWNEGTSPLLWVIGPEQVDLYNGFGAPRKPEDIRRNHLKTCGHDRLGELDDYAGRLVMETGQFWHNESRVNRQNTVDRRLLHHLRSLQDKLVDSDMPILDAQGLIGRSIFAKYLVDRGIVTKQRLRADYGHQSLEQILRQRRATERFFGWLRDTFNGDMFPPGSTFVPNPDHLECVARFLEGEDPSGGQMSLFPYRFDVIPVELISAIYEQFVHLRTVDGERTSSSAGVHYTPVPVVSLVLDEVMQGLKGHETVLDITCGSGIFLVEALRRLVRIKAGNAAPTRRMIRETLYKQIHGIDISEPAVRVAAFSLVLAALELDPDPRPSRSLRFKTLQGNTLLVGNAYDIETTAVGGKLNTETGLRKFDVIVGNPPWGKDKSHQHVALTPSFEGATSLRYLARAKSFAHSRTRFGMVLSATSFFSRLKSRSVAVQSLVGDLSPLTLVNLSNLSSWLFDKANMPAIVLMARYRDQPAEEIELVQTEWSPNAEKGRAIETMPSDVSSLSIASWRRHAELLKAAFYGRLHDQLLLDEPRTPFRPLGDRLREIGVNFSEGLIRGSASDARHVQGLPLLEGIRPFRIENVSEFTAARAERPRDKRTYEAPLLVVQEFMRLVGGGGRALAAVSSQDLVFTNSFNGASFHGQDIDLAYLISAILGSGFASWYFTMEASEFGLWKQRLLLGDIRSTRVPDLRQAITSEAGRCAVSLAKSFERRNPNPRDWRELDEAVFDLYALEGHDRLVVRDGLTRSGWQWDAGRWASMAAANEDQLVDYARTFIETVDPWFDAVGERRLRAEVPKLRTSEPLRFIRFVLEDRPPPSVIRHVDPPDSLTELLAEMTERYGVEAAKKLAEDGELRLGDPREIVFVKPAARRHWLAVNALSDARRVLEESFESIPG